jgi:hypothetical protein
MGEIEKLQTLLPGIEIRAINYGCNIYLPNMVISAYWKRKRYGNSATNKWSTYDNLQDLSEIITGFMPKPKTIVHTESANDSGVKKCINHILAKAERIPDSKGTNCQKMILKTVAAELEQFL